MNLFEEIKKLNFLADKYIVIGGAAMAARGIKETKDIDLVVAPDLFTKCKNDGWTIHRRPNPKDEPGLEKGIVEIYLDVNARGGTFQATFADLKNKQEIIDGIPFCSLEDVMKFKIDYNREKDLKDIELIKNYLK